MQRYGQLLLCVLVCSGISLLTSCQAQTTQTQDVPTRVAADGQLPIVRPLQLTAMTSPMVVEFNVQPPGKSATGTLFLGIRVGDEDALKSLEAAQALRRSGLHAELVLKRLGPSGSINMPLVRVESQAGVPARTIAVSADGRVPGVWMDEVDGASLQSAGLESPERRYTQLAFAWAQGTQPGRYQLSIRLLGQPPQLASIQSELLVAYRHKSK
ncbi:hypothetical protein [Xanthomonas vesicatoria]|uniref:Uncharacterized protein n=1 Tax=Xanthomonas vesicatoria ATCC 35937 TaxID=925775 RepID=F0BAB0_9XANT|nr:hypothetical protein [Xanthomonas vesicatoria]APP76419.1 hypothetical protein BJD12_15585 [Xanthomonas vesicatoria ATCC 35937]EGD10640.1 hypothetical protein XVE_1016 [Xanthomonas vesicatoria ATCC 35937]KTF29555.1 hypothetical protein LMG920_22100 [Xanthomonas vesicatoria]KTF29956.1 hypothetical protein LMG919_21845 [Xanthomonas vesicatoria]MCC8559468.1 hypothetical protein [Xanthomonas vesicatoria]